MDPLPGIELVSVTEMPISDAVEKQISYIESLGIVSDANAVTIAALKRLATAVDIGLSAPRVSVATTKLMDTILELLKQLPVQAEEVSNNTAELLSAIAKAVA